MTKFIQELVNGLTQGGLYALVALGYSMVYGVLKLLNFAHGDLYMVGAFVGYFVLQWLGGPTALAVPVPIVLLGMLLIAGGGVGALGVAIERFAYRPLRDAPRIAPLITALDVSFLLENTMLLVFGASYRDYNTSAFIPFSTGIHMHVVGGVSDRVVALDHGVKIAEGSFDEVASHPAVVEAYLGRDPEALAAESGTS